MGAFAIVRPADGRLIEAGFANEQEAQARLAEINCLEKTLEKWAVQPCLDTDTSQGYLPPKTGSPNTTGV